MAASDQLAALTAWIRTFPEFSDVCTDQILDYLDDESSEEKILALAQQITQKNIPHFTRAVSCSSEASAGSSDTFPPSTTTIWNHLATHLLHANNGNDKLPVLSYLVHYAVSSPNVEQRRIYIERIMKCDKVTQKCLMQLIEQRRASKSCGKKSRSSSRSSSRNASSATPPSALRSSSKYTPASSSNHSSTTATPTPRKAISFSTPATSSQSPSQRDALLSPGTLDSPHQVQSRFRQLQVRNQALQQELLTKQELLTQVQEQLSSLEQNHRKMTLKMESEAMDQQATLQREHKQQVESLEKELAQAQQAQEKLHKELTSTREELDVQQHSQTLVDETSEKLRKYRDKVHELSDCKEALKQEQEAHAQRIEEIVSLESELAQLQAVKRQLEEYKIRAIEAEVKVVESQDSLARIERRVREQGDENDSLLRNTLMQEQQMDELRARIVQETQQQVDSGVGDGISELNPELYQELLKLRAENVQLRAFSAKREQDEVARLEQRVEDTQASANKFQAEYLDCKNLLGETQTQLNASEKRVAEATEQCDKSQVLCTKLQSQLEQSQALLNDTQIDLEQSRKEIQDLTENLRVANVSSAETSKLLEERSERVEALEDHISNLQDEIHASQQAIAEFRSNVDSWEAYSKELEHARDEATEQLADTQEELAVTKEQAQTRIESLERHLNKLETMVTDLEATLEQERSEHTAALDEATSRLESMERETVAQMRNDYHELEANMNQMLEEERQASRDKQEQYQQHVDELESKWQGDYQELEARMTETLQKTSGESEDRITQLQQKHEDALVRVKQEADAKQDDIIRKGKSMIEDAKRKARETFQELVDARDEVESRLEASEKAKTELQHHLHSKISKLKQNTEYLMAQSGNLNQQNEELTEQIKSLEREKSKLEEDNDRYRRQLGGRYGADGRSQSQYEKLQKEFNDVVEENRNLKRQMRQRSQSLRSVAEEAGSQSYSRISRSTITQLRREYEETITSLNDEKRELIMKHSAAMTDVQKAEQRAWEREEELSKYKAEITSLKLTLQRFELSRTDSRDSSIENKSPAPRDDSFYSAGEEHRSPPLSHRPSTPPRPVPTTSPARHSPNIERSLRKRLNSEEEVRSRLEEMRLAMKSPSPVLKETQKASPRQRPSGIPKSPPRSSPNKPSPTKVSLSRRTIVDAVQTERRQVQGDGNEQECQQS